MMRVCLQGLLGLVLFNITWAYNPVLEVNTCSPSRIVVTLSGAADGGIIYIKGYGAACKQDTFSNTTVHEFDFDACGINAETYFTLIVQKNPQYQTGYDLQEYLLCIYDLSDISVSNGIGVNDKADDGGVNKTVKPTAHMKLYNDGLDVSGGSVKLSDDVSLIIMLDNEYIEDFDIKARHCSANHIDVILDFCSTDTELFPNFQHATQGALASTFGAFRTTALSGGSVSMTFSCTLQVCLSSCSPTSCSVGDEGWGKRRRRALDSIDYAYDDLSVGASFAVGSEVDAAPADDENPNEICVNILVFLILAILVGFIAIASISSTAFVTKKLIKRTEEFRKLNTSGFTFNSARCATIPSSSTMDGGLQLTGAFSDKSIASMNPKETPVTMPTTPIPSMVRKLPPASVKHGSDSSVSAMTTLNASLQHVSETGRQQNIGPRKDVCQSISSFSVPGLLQVTSNPSAMG